MSEETREYVRDLESMLMSMEKKMKEAAKLAIAGAHDSAIITLGYCPKCGIGSMRGPFPRRCRCGFVSAISA